MAALPNAGGNAVRVVVLDSLYGCVQVTLDLTASDVGAAAFDPSQPVLVSAELVSRVLGLSWWPAGREALARWTACTLGCISYRDARTPGQARTLVPAEDQYPPPTHTQAKHSFAARALRSPSRDAAPTQTWRLFESFPCHSQRRPPPAATFCGSAPRAADPRWRPLGLSHRALAPPCLPCQGPQLWLLPCWGPACGVWQLSGSWHSHRGEHSPLRTTHILSIPWLAAAQLWAP